MAMPSITKQCPSNRLSNRNKASESTNSYRIYRESNCAGITPYPKTYSNMCFDIDVEKMTLQALYETHTRISSLLRQQTVLERLPDKGHQLKQVAEKLKKEIKFREDLEATRSKMGDLCVKSASESSLTGAHGIRLCSLERRPAQERFKPNSLRRSSPSGRSESMKDLHTGVKRLDLPMSLQLQREQEERIKTELMRSKQNRLMMEAMFYKNFESSSTSECEQDTFAALLEGVPEESDEMNLFLMQGPPEHIIPEQCNIMPELALDLSDDLSSESGQGELAAGSNRGTEETKKENIVLIGEASAGLQGSDEASAEVKSHQKILIPKPGGVSEETAKINVVLPKASPEPIIGNQITAMALQDSDDSASEAELDQERLAAGLEGVPEKENQVKAVLPEERSSDNDADLN